MLQLPSSALAATAITVVIGLAACGGGSSSHNTANSIPENTRAGGLRPQSACPQIVQSGSDEKVNSTNSTVQFSALPVNGTQLVLIATTGSNATFTAPAAYTPLKSSAGYRSAALFVSTSAPVANPKFVASSGTASGLGVTFGNTSGAIEGSSINVTGPSSTGSSAAVAATQSGDVFSMLAMNDATTSNVTSAPAGFTEASPTGGVTGQTFSQRDYYLVNPPAGSSQPVIQWNFNATGNTTITAYAALSPATCATPTPAPTPTGAPVARVQSTAVAPSGKVASSTATLANAPAPGDLLTACAMTEDNFTIPTPAGWTLLQSLAGKGGGIAFYQFYKIAAASETKSLTITPSSPDWQSLSLREYTGEDPVHPFAGFANGSTNANVLSVTAVPTVAGALPSSCFAANSAMGATAHTAGATEDYDAYASTAAGNGFVPAYNAAEGQTGPIQPGTASYASTVTWNLSAGNGPYTYGFLAFVAPRPTATPTPAPTPSATPTPGGTCCTTAVEWPNGFEPYAATSVWNHRLTNPDNPVVYAQSSAIMANIVLKRPDGTPNDFHTDEYGNGDATFHPIVFVNSINDPNAVQVNVACDIYCNGWGSNGLGLPPKIYIPAQARPATGSDHHLAVVQPNGDEMDCWLARQKNTNDPKGYNTWSPPGTNEFHAWNTSDTLLCGDGQNMGSFYGGSGQSSQALANAATAGGAAEAAGIVRASELAAGQINHALFMVSGCVDPKSYVYPAFKGGDMGSCGGAGAQMMFGSLVHVKLTDAQINASTTLTRDQKTILRALHDYGGLVMDTRGHPSTYTDVLAIEFESGAAFTPFGAAPPMDTYAAAQGWPQQTNVINEYYQADASGFNWQNVLEVLDPCNVRATC